jgi:hypothetical protein
LFSSGSEEGTGIPIARRLAVVFVAAGFLSLQLYAAPLPEMYAVITHLYVKPSTGFAPFSMEFLREIIRGVTAGFGGLLPVLVIFIVGIIGIGILFRVSWLLTAALGLPPLLTSVFLIVGGLSFSPRFFLILIPLGILAIMAAAEAPIASLFRSSGLAGSSHPRRAAVVGALVAFASLMSLPRYYATPKQPYRATLAYLQTVRQPSEKVVFVYAAEIGIPLLRCKGRGESARGLRLYPHRRRIRFTCGSGAGPGDSGHTVAACASR